MTERTVMLERLEERVLWLATWMIHHANHIRPNADGLKVGGHQASSASMATIMTALYFDALRAEDRVAVKPHASPIFHAIHYLAGRQSLERMKNFRGFGGAQSYPSRTKDFDDVDFSTGSVGLGVAQTLFASLVQDYVAARFKGDAPGGRMVALAGDAEMDEGNIFEALHEGSKHGLRNTWWVVDYNRQSLDAVVTEGLWERLDSVFRTFGWDVVVLKHGRLMEAAFAEPGGARLRDWIDACPNQVYSALAFQGGAAWRRRLLEEAGNDPDLVALLARRTDAELARLMSNLGGHDMSVLCEAFAAARQHDRPVCFIAYTIKGFGLPLIGHKDNHAGILTAAQIDELKATMNVRPGHEWARLEGTGSIESELERLITEAPFFALDQRRTSGSTLPIPAALAAPAQPAMSTQQGFGLLMHEIARSGEAYADRIVTTSPDVTVSTNLGAWVNRRGIFSRETIADEFRSNRIPSTFMWDQSPRGQHIELGIAEMNLFILLSALGLSHELFGERLLPIGTLYDPFIQRGLDALNYACYQDARFITVATPSGITLAPEGGAHQSIATPLIGMAQDGLASFEPAFVDELAVLLRFSFEYIQRAGGKSRDATTWLRDAAGGSVYLRLSSRTIDQPKRTIDESMRADIVNGAYWLRHPGPNAELVLAYTGAVAPEAIAAAGLMAEDRRDVGVLAVTSADRLNAGWTAAQRAREEGHTEAVSHVERLFDSLPAHCGLVTVIDGHPATLAWLGAVRGNRTRSLGVEHFGQTGTIADLYRHYGIDAAGIIAAAEALAPRRPIRYARRLEETISG